ncbi:FAD-binding oxidoreductase [Tropicibacter sp. R15_0]|uniref:NAD(P)/FAD-dependent oxidoreductase n=1 Tax=Tropicibacter sp. R15_0 TaxID=2821101 RepID=UPI001ADCF18B|nr:FAD-binding oxidoreductase [Tropicibacter sp. R15_0]MBO9467815.1 FAD-binding oxidoreductase [Tropicibacter sp. R15_0]
MEYASYWHATAPTFEGDCPAPVQGHFDVAIIGAGFTGLSAALTLAKSGVSVAVLEADHVGAGGSGRNGGHLNNGIAHGYADAKATLGAERAKALYQAFDQSIETIKTIIAEEEIDCDFRHSGKLKLASKPSHIAGLKANYELVHQEVDPDTAWLEKSDLASEVLSPDFHGAALFKKSAMMHMGRYVVGLANAATRHGAQIWHQAPVTGRSKTTKGWALSTEKGTLTADRVIAATGAYSAQIKTAPLGYFRKRIIPVGSFIIATRPLSQDEVAASLPGNRTYVTSLNIGNYFRLSPDNRLIFGGRARFSATSDPQSDAKSGVILQKTLGKVFPQLAEVDIDYCWGGLVGMTGDRFPRAGIHNDMIYGMGYSGHGAQYSTLLGQQMALMALGKPVDCPVAELNWPAIPAHSGKPWFLPLVGMWFGLKDRIS